MNKILDYFFHRHTFNSAKWEKVDFVNVYETDTELTTWLYTQGQKKQDRKIVEIRTTYQNCCSACGMLVTKQIIL